MPRKNPLLQDAENKDTPTLTPSEAAFVNAYFDENMNGTRAYMKCYPKSSYDASRSSAPVVLAKPSVQAEISRRLKEKAMSSDEVIARIGDMARASHKPFIQVSEDGFVYFDFSDEDAQASLPLIKKIKTKRERRIEGHGESAEEWEDESIEVELYDAQRALELLGKHHKIFDEAPKPVTLELSEKTIAMLEKIYGNSGIAKPQP